MISRMEELKRSCEGFAAKLESPQDVGRPEPERLKRMVQRAQLEMGKYAEDDLPYQIYAMLEKAMSDYLQKLTPGG